LDFYIAYLYFAFDNVFKIKNVEKN